MYRVFVHIYIHHFDTLTALSAVSRSGNLKMPTGVRAWVSQVPNTSTQTLDCEQVPHVNLCYKHYYYFVTEFNLVSKKELEPLVSCRKN
jgi:hypothetical protein